MMVTVMDDGLLFDWSRVVVMRMMMMMINNQMMCRLFWDWVRLM